MFEKLLFLLSFWRRQFNTSVKYYCTQNWKSLSELVRGKQYTEWHRIIDSTYLHVSTRNISHAKAQRARRFMGTQNAQNDTEFCFWQKNIFLSHADDADVRRKLCDTLRLCVRINNIVCESLCRLRETKTRRKDSVSSVSSVWKTLTQTAQTTQKLCETLRLCVRMNNIVCESLRCLREIYLHRDSVSYVWK